MASSLHQIRRLTFVAMLTPDDASSDGGFVDYPMAEADGHLYLFLQNCLGQRLAGCLDAAGLFRRLSEKFLL